MSDLRQGILRGPTGAELAENELHRQQVIDASNQATGNETQDVIVVQRSELYIVPVLFDFSSSAMYLI